MLGSCFIIYVYGDRNLILGSYLSLIDWCGFGILINEEEILGWMGNLFIDWKGLRLNVCVLYLKNIYYGMKYVLWIIMFCGCVYDYVFYLKCFV